MVDKCFKCSSENAVFYTIICNIMKLINLFLLFFSSYFHSLGPPGRVGLVVAMSADLYVPPQFFL